jgi:uncharacterized protein (DUF305 family)
MKFYSKHILIVLMAITFVGSFVSCAQVREEKSAAKTNSSTTTNNSKDELESLINATFPFIEDLLKKHEEFFPMAAALDKNDKIVQVGTYDDDEKPLSQNVIDDLKSGLRDGAKKGDYKSIAIFYDVKAVNPATKEKTDAVAVFVENNRDSTAFTIYYPYSLTKGGVLTFAESWKNASAKEIFIKSKNENN